MNDKTATIEVRWQDSPEVREVIAAASLVVISWGEDELVGRATVARKELLRLQHALFVLANSEEW